MAEIPTQSLKEYPDITGLLEEKEKRRIENANRSFAEKIEIVKRLNAASKLWKNSKVVDRK
jgi:hypothetical protein